MAHPIESRTFSAALFDMDGTLIDSTPAVERSWMLWAKAWGIQVDFRDGAHGRPARDLIASLVPVHHVDEALAHVTQLEIDDTGDVVPLPGAVALLESIPDARRAIVTSCVRPLAGVRIAASGIPVMSTVVTVDDIERGKPHPDPFLEGARRLGVDPGECVAFEDAPAGLAAARAAGCVTVGVVGTHAADELDADLVVESLENLTIEVSDQGLRLVLAAG